MQVAGTVTQLTNSPGTHEVSCLCDMPENAEEGLLVHCDSCNKWVHCKCYSLDEQTIGRDRFGGLHPITALQLYTSIALPRMLYGAEIWCITNTELKMFERAHRRILRTIQGLPIRCPKESIGTLLGCSTISDLITYKKLSFLISNAALPPTALPGQVLQCRL